MDAKLQSLMERVCQLGRLLPDVNDIDTDDPFEVAEVTTIVAETQQTEAQAWERLRELRKQGV